jgi:thymidylate synthase
MYRGGYSNQFRHSGRMDYSNKNFDQVQYLLDGLRNNPNSRRLVLTTWNPWEMAHITELNHNPNCPTCCHSTIIQLFVRHDTLFMTSYQRSCDVLLGLPHNLIQSWALLLYFAHHAKLNVGTLRWLLGDAHLYLEPSHQQAAQEIVSRSVFTQVDNPVRLVYKPNEGNGGQVPEFKAEDFEMEGEIPEPMCRIRPTLL